MSASGRLSRLIEHLELCEDLDEEKLRNLRTDLRSIRDCVLVTEHARDELAQDAAAAFVEAGSESTKFCSCYFCFGKDRLPGEHHTCEMYKHHCESCHARGFCTLAECVGSR